MFIENCSLHGFNFSDRFTAENTLPSISAHSQHYTWNEGESVMTIAILAHDSRKELALQFCTAYSGILSRNTVIATGTTGRMLA